MSNFSINFNCFILIIICGFSLERLVNLHNKVDRLSMQIDSLCTSMLSSKIDTLYQVQATCYNAVAEQCDADYLCTASGLTINSTNTAYDHRYLAVSRDLLNIFPYGTEVYVSGTSIYDGIWKVADTMNKRFSNRIDFLINPDMFKHKWTQVYIKKI